MNEVTVTINMYKPEGGYVDTPGLERYGNCSISITKEPGARVKMNAKVYITAIPTGGVVLVPLYQPTITELLDDGWLCATPTIPTDDGNRLYPDHVAAVIERNVYEHQDVWHNATLKELLGIPTYEH